MTSFVSKKEGRLFKLDFEKTYDMDWLLEVIDHKGFGARCIRWMKASITDTSFSILINGRPHAKIKASRGLQGKVI